MMGMTDDSSAGSEHTSIIIVPLEGGGGDL